MNTRSFAAAVALAAFCAHAQSAPVFTQTPVLVSGSGSDSSGITQAADDFAFGGMTTVRSVQWRGLYFPTGTPQPSDDFTINFYANAAAIIGTPPPGTVGALLGSFHVGPSVNRTDTGQVLLNVSMYGYTADLGSGITFSAGTPYWISIVNNTAVDPNDNWFWGVNNAPGGNDRFTNDGGASWNSNASANWFILDDANVAAAVPEPAALALLGLGLAALGFARRRRSQKLS